MTKIQLRIPLIIAAAMLVQPGHAVPPTITFSPVSPISLSANQTTSGGPPMTITCTQPQVAGTSAMVSLFIKRLPATGGAEQTLVSADINNKAAQVASGITGMTADGNLDTRSIRGTITNMACDKAGMYICESTYLVTAETTKDRVTANYTVEVSPGSVDLTYTALTLPSGAGWFHIGDTVQFTCSANVGSVDTTTRIVFNWEYETTNSGIPSWVTYPNFEDVTNETPAHPTSGTCSTQIYKSYLVRNLTSEDNERRYRCYVSKNNVPYEDHAAIYTLPIVEDPTATTTTAIATTMTAAATTTTAAATTTTAAATTTTADATTTTRATTADGSVHDGSVGAVVRGVVETVTILLIIAVVTTIN